MSAWMDTLLGRARVDAPPAVDETPPDHGKFGARLTADAVRRAAFTRVPLGRRGLDENEVETFRRRVARELHEAAGEVVTVRARNRALMEENRRLLDYYRAQNSDLDLPGGGSFLSPAAATADAVDIMARAQQAADAAIAQSEESARRLMASARAQYDRILMRANEQASQAVAAAQALGDGGDDEEARQVRDELVYLRAFTQSTKTQLVGALRGLLDDVARLDDAIPPPSGAPRVIAAAPMGRPRVRADR